MAYTDLMKAHLARYKVDRLGINQSGKWRNREYAHILPPDRIFLNILAPIQQDFARYQESHPSLKLHRDFAHLNSSQAACINLFLPVFVKALDLGFPDDNPLPFEPAEIETCQFEYVPDEVEGTNFDFWVRTRASKEVFCEFKLTESDFGRARDNARHRQKLVEIYRPMLAGKVDPEILEPDNFFARYQLLRNIAYADTTASAHVLLIVPKANERLTQRLAEMRNWLTPTLRPFVTVLYLEDIVSWLRSAPAPQLRAHYDEYAAKYVPSTEPA